MSSDTEKPASSQLQMKDDKVDKRAQALRDNMMKRKTFQKSQKTGKDDATRAKSEE